jgi:aspartate aminotransferase-like enzyme
MSPYLDREVPADAATWRSDGGTSAAKKCISLVPGLAKQVLTPDASSVRTRVSAPFNAGFLVWGRDRMLVVRF